MNGRSLLCTGHEPLVDSPGGAVTGANPFGNSSGSATSVPVKAAMPG